MGRDKATSGGKGNKNRPRSDRGRNDRGNGKKRDDNAEGGRKPKREEYNTEGARRQSSVLKRNRASRERITAPGAPRESRHIGRTIGSQTQERTGGSVISQANTAAQRWFYTLVRQGGILNIRTKFVNDLATYQLARATKRAFDDEANADFNRYPDVTLHDHTRVVLKNGPDGSDYVHASHVKGAEFPMICAQGPVENSIDNFWTLVVEQNCGVIVQLCENQEEGREKCADYLPTEPSEFGNVSVSVKEPSHVTVANPSVHRTVLEASLPNSRTVEVVHLLYDGWPDRDVPLSPAAFRQLRGTVHKLAMARKCTVLIHCSAGIGRTGTYAAIEMAYRDLIANDREVQMSTILQRLRDQRALAVQTDLQYVFLHRAIIDMALDKGRLTRADKAAGVDQFIREYEELIQRKRKARKELERKHRRRQG
uniref:Uncharacterized protein n=4 Tax=Meloidogyne TaxID=189290 RepID=A0A6V7X522_MELEN|nr:unnamed protein product [Meloidogyne enterolobii]